MKGYSATMVIGIVVAVIIAGFILFIAWSKGFLPFSKATTEAQCKAYFVEDCQKAAALGWSNPDIIFSNVKGCKYFVSNQNAFEYCVNGNWVSGYTYRSDACRDMCSEFLNNTAA